MNDIAKCNENMATNEKSDKEKESWVEGDEIKELWESLKEEADYLYKKKLTLRVIYKKYRILF